MRTPTTCIPGTADGTGFGVREEIVTTLHSMTAEPPAVHPAAAVGGVDVHVELERLRASIDNLDAALVHLLAERFKCTQQVGVLKAEHGLPPADTQRETEQIARLRRLAKDAKLDPEFAEKFLNFVIAEVVRHHEAIAKQ
jgi:chorismate mutase